MMKLSEGDEVTIRGVSHRLVAPIRESRRHLGWWALNSKTHLATFYPMEEITHAVDQAAATDSS